MPESTPPNPTRLTTLRGRWTLGAVAALGLALTGVGVGAAWHYRAAARQRYLAEAAREMEDKLRRQADAAETFVETVAAFFESSVEVTHAEFESFVGRTAGRWPGMVAVEWQAWVPRARRADFEARLRQEIPDFRIVERDAAGQPVPAAEREVHVPVVYIHSAVAGLPQPGLDLAADSTWFGAKLATMDAPHATASPPFGIVSADGRDLGEGFSISDAVFASGTGPARERLRGFVSVIFATQPMIEAAIAGTPVDHLRVAVRDSAGGAPVTLGGRAGDRPAGAADDDLTAVSTIRIGGRAWEITISAAPGYLGPVVRWLPWLALAAGGVVTLGCATALAWRLRLRGERAVRATERLAVEQRFRDIVDRMAGAVIVVRRRAGDPRFLEIIEHNAAAERLLGHAAGGLTGRELAEVLSGPAEIELRDSFGRAVRDGGFQRVEIVLPMPEESARQLEGVVFHVGEGDDFCAVLQDLTDLKNAEGALRQARDDLELALDVSRVGLWSWELRERLVRIDARCARLLGQAGAGVVQETDIQARVHPDDMKVVREEVDRALREMRSYEVEYRFTLPDGTLRYLCTRARPVREDALPVNRIVGCTWDVTERRRMEEHLRRTQRLESLGTLAGGVAHDLNNALAPVTMGLDLLKRRVSADGEAVDSIKLMQTSVRRASSIVRQLIAFKRGAGESKQPAPAHPRRVLEILGVALTESFPKEIAVVIEPASLDLPRIVADEREAHQVLLNLCANARDAMPQGGRLVVACESFELGPANQALFPELRRGAYVMFVVSDNGRGIAPEIRDRVFDPFFTTKEVGKGSGLGLSTALGIVKAHRGGIQFESREGAGTTFRVVIPTLVDDEPAGTTPAGPVSAPTVDHPVSTPCLLLVDDEAQVRELARRALEQSGFKVMTAGNGREAVELFMQHVQAVDAVIMDLLMPVMNGAAATAAIKRLRPDVPIVGASGFATDALVDEAKAAGITTFLPKPFTVTVLVDAVRAAMATKRG